MHFGVCCSTEILAIYLILQPRRRAGGPPLSPALKILDSFHSSIGAPYLPPAFAWTYRVFFWFSAAGLGVAFTQAMVVYTSLLWDALGPGTIMAHSCSGLTLFTYTGNASLSYQTHSNLPQHWLRSALFCSTSLLPLLHSTPTSPRTVSPSV